jgi:hypothetical protein
MLMAGAINLRIVHALLFILFLTLLLSQSLGSPIRFATAASSSEFSNANDFINSAFLAVQTAEGRGGNVSSLVDKLNLALALFQKASSENSTDPTQASTDLNSTVQLAQQVASAADKTAAAGASERSNQKVDIFVSIALTLIILSLITAFGDRMYDRIWFYRRKDFLVRTQK